MAKKQRSIILDDTTFAELKAIVLARQLKGHKASISSVVEELIKGYLKEHGDELRNVQSMQISLFDFVNTSTGGTSDGTDK